MEHPETTVDLTTVDLNGARIWETREAAQKAADGLNRTRPPYLAWFVADAASGFGVVCASTAER